MSGWIIPSPKRPTKTIEQFRKEREEKVGWLITEGYLRSEAIKEAMLKVRREEFIPDPYRDYAYMEVPLPLPGVKATISCPHSYPLFYEALGLKRGDRFLEIGVGSGYGAALAREIVGSEGLVVSIEIDPRTFEFARNNFMKAGYEGVLLVQGDGGYGYSALSPYDKIAMTAACPEFPQPLIEQLKIGGRLIAPVTRQNRQDLVLLEKTREHLKRTIVCRVLYVSLRGAFG